MILEQLSVHVMKLSDIPIEKILAYQQKWWDNKDLPFCYEAFPEYPPKLVFKKMEQLADRDYLEYGISLRTAWLTDKGKEYLKQHDS